RRFDAEVGRGQLRQRAAEFSDRRADGGDEVDLFVELGHLSVSQFMPSVVEASLEARARVPIESGAAADSSTTLLMTRPSTAPRAPFPRAVGRRGTWGVAPPPA